MESDPRQEITLYIENAQEVLEVAQLNLDNGFYTSAVNRAYYAIFYAANAILVTKRLSQRKHSGVINAFRQHFVKTGLIAPQYSDVYGRIMGNRHTSDYELESSITEEIARADLVDAIAFVAEINRWLKQEGWL
jgi:uncharacterized protein (UPF0332 family)